MSSKSSAVAARAATARALACFDVALPVLSGAVAAMLVLWLLRCGAKEVWAPFVQSGLVTLRALALSSLAGALVATALSRHAHGPVAAMACALGWAGWGLWLHFGAQGRYLEIVGGGFSKMAAFSVLFNNAIAQSLVVGCGLSLALFVRWIWARRQGSPGDGAPISDDDLEGNGLKSFNTALIYPLSILVGGAIMLNICALLVIPLGQSDMTNLPSEPGIAFWCGLLTLVALSVTTLFARRVFSVQGRANDILLAPLLIMLVATLGQTPLPLPAGLLIWHTSAFEIANWAALGAALGFYFARPKTRS